MMNIITRLKVLKLQRKNLTRTFQRQYEQSVNVMEKTIDVNKVPIHYVQIGHGPHVVFPIPGAFGTGRTDYTHFVELFDEDKYTFILWDPVGRGKSRFPGERELRYNNDYRDLEGQFASEFMDKLGIQRYSLLGWCYGGQIALRIAAARKECVNKVVISGVRATITEEECVKVEKFAHNFTEARNQNLPLKEKLWMVRIIQAHGGETYFKNIRQGLVNGYWDTLRKSGGNLCLDAISKVEAEVLVLHGDKDPLCPLEQALFMVQNLKRAKLRRFPEAKHKLFKRNHEVHELVDSVFQSTRNDLSTGVYLKDGSLSACSRLDK